MRTIKFLGFAVAMAAAAVSATAQGNLQPGAFPGIDRLARIEANRLVHQDQMRQLGAQAFGRNQANGRFGQVRGARGQGIGGRGFAAAPRAGICAGACAGVQAGTRAEFRAGVRAERLTNATPEQKAFVEQFRTQRSAVHAQVLEGKLTREQARAQMQKWVTEHRPKE